ncbi:putative membrane protein [Bacteroides fragilis str. J38-1]|nr:putative membrane protein [Bacteroides fragilis str. J38-1]
MTDEAFANICFCVINNKYFEFIYIFIKLRKIIKKRKI